MSSCKWRLFGARIVVFLLSLPVEVVLCCVAMRETQDITFYLNLRINLDKKYSEMIDLDWKRTATFWYRDQLDKTAPDNRPYKLVSSAYDIRGYWGRIYDTNGEGNGQESENSDEGYN